MAPNPLKLKAENAINSLITEISVNFPTDLTVKQIKKLVYKEIKEKYGKPLAWEGSADVLKETVNFLANHYNLPNPLTSQAGPGESALSQPDVVEGNNLESTENTAGKDAFNNTPTEGPPFQPANPTTFSVNTNGQFIKNEPIENKIAETLTDIDNIQKQTKAGQKVVKAETKQEVDILKSIAAQIPVTEMPQAAKANEKDYKAGLVFRDPVQEAQDRYNDYIRQIKKSSLYA